VVLLASIFVQPAWQFQLSSFANVGTNQGSGVPYSHLCLVLVLIIQTEQIQDTQALTKKISLVRSQLPRPHHISVYLRGGAYRLKLTVWSGQAWRLETVLCKESQTDTWRPFLLTLVQDGPDVYPGQTIAIEQASGINNFYLALLFAYIVPVHKEVASSPVAPL
jgi:hypothetical protein